MTAFAATSGSVTDGPCGAPKDAQTCPRALGKWDPSAEPKSSPRLEAHRGPGSGWRPTPRRRQRSTPPEKSGTRSRYFPRTQALRRHDSRHEPGSGASPQPATSQAHCTVSRPTRNPRSRPRGAVGLVGRLQSARACYRFGCADRAAVVSDIGRRSSSTLVDRTCRRVNPCRR